MARVDQATVEALQLTAPWASTLDAKILRGKMLGGELFCHFSQQEREAIWIRLQSFKGLVPSLFEIFENVKCLEAWADCLKWLVCLGPRETLSTAMEKIYTGINQSVDLALVQKNETTFKSVPASSARRIGLGHRQLCAFAMRYHREIPKKPSGKDLLAKPRAILDTTKLREMADLANRLGFESSEITALKQFSKSADSTIVSGNEKPALVTDGPGEIRKDRCGMPHTQSYEEDRKFLFITHLHEDRDEQSEGITSYFRLRSIYLKFYGMPDDSNPQKDLTITTGELLSPAFRLTQSAYSPREDPTPGAEHMEVDGEQTEDTMMQDGDGEGEGEEQRPPFQAEGALTQETTMQRQKLLSEAGVLEKTEYEQEQCRQKLARDANALVEEEQRLEQKRQKLLSNASTLENQEQEQGQRRQKLLSHTTILEKQEQEQERHRQKLAIDASAFEERDQEKDQQRQKLLSDVSTLEQQENEQKQYRQRLARDAIALREQEQEQERRRQKLISDASALKESEQEHEQMYQKFTQDTSSLREQEQKREEQLQTLAREEKELFNRKQRQEGQRQTLAVDASELDLQEQKQKERRNALAVVADELVNQEQSQKEQRQKLAEYASDLGEQELRQNEQRKKLTADISELQKQEQKSVKPKISGSELDESGTIQKPDERDVGELQRQGQEELADLELPSPLELEYGGIDADQSAPEVRAQNYSMDAVQRDGTQVSVSAPKDQNSPAQGHGPQRDRVQVKGQEERLTEEAHEPGAQERGQKHGVQERRHEHQTQENEQEDRAHGNGAYEDGAHEDEAYEDAAHNDKVQGGRQADKAQEVVQEDKAHGEGQDGGVQDDEVREYRQRKRRVMTEESDDGAALRAQQVREGRKPVEKGKYQRLNRFVSSNYNTNEEDGMSTDDTEERVSTIIPRKRQPRQDLQAQKRAGAMSAENTDGSTGLTSEFTYEAPQAPSRTT